MLFFIGLLTGRAVQLPHITTGTHNSKSRIDFKFCNWEIQLSLSIETKIQFVILKGSKSRRYKHKKKQQNVRTIIANLNKKIF